MLHQGVETVPDAAAERARLGSRSGSKLYSLDQLVKQIAKIFDQPV
jgi:hypothetical protein